MHQWKIDLPEFMYEVNKKQLHFLYYFYGASWTPGCNLVFGWDCHKQMNNAGCHAITDLCDRSSVHMRTLSNFQRKGQLYSWKIAGHDLE